MVSDAKTLKFCPTSEGMIICYFPAGGPGLSDPCEKDPIDSFHSLNPQSRENLTSYAQVSYNILSILHYMST